MKKQDFVVRAAAERRERSGKRRVLLINPPYNRPLGYSSATFNLGLGYIAAVLEQAGYDVAIYNAELELGLKPQKNYTHAFENSPKYMKAFLKNECTGEFWEELSSVIKAYDPWFIGISTLTNKFTIVEKMTAFIKSLNPDLFICLGGYHPTMFPREVMENKNVNFVISGEAEESIVELLDYLGGKTKDLAPAPNVFYKEKGTIKGTKVKRRIKNIDALPLVARGALLGYEEFPSHYISAMMVSRGCPFSCSYCGTEIMFGKSLYYRSPGNVVKEIENMNRTFGVHRFHFHDDTFNVKKNYTKEIVEKIGAFNTQMEWTCNLRLDLVDDRQLEEFKNNGCRAVWFGIESGSPRILREVNKGIDKETIKKQVAIVKRSGIPWGGYFMLGFPGESKEDMSQTLEFAKELEPDHASVNIFNPLPGTELYRRVFNHIQQDKKMDWSLQSQTCLENIRLWIKDTDNIEDFVLRLIEDFDEYNSGRKSI